MQSAPSPPLYRRLIYWLPTLLWLCVLATFSTDLFSSEHTGSVLAWLLEKITPGVTATQFREIHFLVRKMAHVTSYGTLSIFAFFAFRETLPAADPWVLRWSGLALLLTFFAGCADEFHQGFVSSRTSTPVDVMLDTAGALLFQAVLAAFLLRLQRPSVTVPRLGQ